MKSVNSTSGFTLIEVLIAMVVLAVGLLGLAALQATSLKNNQSAYFRSQATQLAYDIADRMRTNVVALNAGQYNNRAATADNCNANTCTPAEMAGYDLAQWNQQIAAQLPSGVGLVCIDNTPEDGQATAAQCDGSGDAYAVKLWWDDNREGAANQRFVISFQP